MVAVGGAVVGDFAVGVGDAVAGAVRGVVVGGDVGGVVVGVAVRDGVAVAVGVGVRDAGAVGVVVVDGIGDVGDDGVGVVVDENTLSHALTTTRGEEPAASGKGGVNGREIDNNCHREHDFPYRGRAGLSAGHGGRRIDTGNHANAGPEWVQ